MPKPQLEEIVFELFLRCRVDAGDADKKACPGLRVGDRSDQTKHYVVVGRIVARLHLNANAIFAQPQRSAGCQDIYASVGSGRRFSRRVTLDAKDFRDQSRERVSCKFRFNE